jgi:tRNA dimethylallyltransferase
MQYNLIVILGPTTSGKTGLAARLAGELGGEILSADSRQVYRGMDIGTGKDLDDYMINGVRIPCHLIDIVTPDYEFSVYEYQKRFFECFFDIHRRGVIPIMVGGTGLYLEAVLRDYRMPDVPECTELRNEIENLDMKELKERLLALNPSLHNTTDLTERNRLIRAIEIAEYTKRTEERFSQYSFRIVPLITGVRWDRKVLRERIRNRLKARMDGMIKEVRRLRLAGIGWERLDSFGLEYRYVSLYLRGKLNCEELFETLNIRIGQYAKRQETWFRGMERRGLAIHWIDNSDYSALRNLIRENMGC